MKQKSWLPWLCVLVALGCAGFLYGANRRQQDELMKLRQDSQELQTLRASAESKEAQTPADSEELARLRKDKEELLRLRSEVHQLREEKQQLNIQVQSVQANAQAAQAQAQAEVASAKAAQAAALSAQQQAAAMSAAQQAGAAGSTVRNLDLQTLACINNLRQIEGAKQQWALENKKTAEAVPTVEDLAPYLKGNNAQLACPAGGVYTLNAVGVEPTCSIPGHSLSK